MNHTHYITQESLNYIRQKTYAKYHAEDTQETHALHYTVNTCTYRIFKLHHTDTLHRKHMHNSTQETHALL